MYTLKLKDDQLHQHSYLHMPTEYRHTGKHLKLAIITLVMLLLFAALGKANPLISTSAHQKSISESVCLFARMFVCVSVI